MKSPASGKLVLVPTPIGNLGDMTFRAVETLQTASLIAAEDTRNTSKLLHHYEISTPMVSFHKFNEHHQGEKLIQRLKNGETIAVVSDAGTPGISDPASELVQLAVHEGITIEALPGATALIPAVVASGLPCDTFCFLGFLPRKISRRDALIGQIRSFPGSVILYESPHRIGKTVRFLLKTLGNRSAAIARELSKIHESYYRGTLEQFDRGDIQVPEKGEFVLVLGPPGEGEISVTDIREALREALNSGMSRRDAVKAIADRFSASRNEVYEMSLTLDSSTDQS